MTLAWSNIAKFTPCERKVLAWADANAQFPFNSLNEQQLAVVVDMEKRRMVKVKISPDAPADDSTITFYITELGQIAAMQAFLSPEQVENERIRKSRYENEALF